MWCVSCLLEYFNPKQSSFYSKVFFGLKYLWTLNEQSTEYQFKMALVSNPNQTDSLSTFKQRLVQTSAGSTLKRNFKHHFSSSKNDKKSVQCFSSGKGINSENSMYCAQPPPSSRIMTWCLITSCTVNWFNDQRQKLKTRNL